MVGPSKAIEILLNDGISPLPTLEAGPSQRSWHRTSCSTGPAKRPTSWRRSPPLREDGKHLVHQSLDNSITEQLQLERHGIANGMGTEDSKNAIEAFLTGGNRQNSKASSRRPGRASGFWQVRL